MEATTSTAGDATPPFVRALDPIRIDSDATYTVVTLAAAFSVTERTIQRWRKGRGKFPRPFEVGGRPYWTGRAVLTWLNNRQEEASK